MATAARRAFIGVRVIGASSSRSSRSRNRRPATIASMTVPQSAVRAVVANIQRLEAGEALQHVVDLKRGY